MINQGKVIARSGEINAKVAQLLEKRVRLAQDHFWERSNEALGKHAKSMFSKPRFPWEMGILGGEYMVDWVQRQILFWDTLRQRGNNYLEHERAGKPPLLHFEYETVLDARKFDRPVNYALLRILPPKGVTIDPNSRPYIIIDPRAGHGPGIGGFKDDSQVGVAMRAGHPVYFVIFFPDPEPGQTLIDITAAEQQFVRKVRELHPDSPKPVLNGNCQGGWAAMMLAGASPEDVGPIVINGAPMSYWGGAWSEGEGDNPMRYLGGLLGGTWLASLGADLGNGIFDGAWLVQNFEILNPANSFWDKYYHVFSNVDTEPPRFLEFERWWGGFFLLNREEMEWISQNLFVGNKLWSGDVRARDGHSFDLREIQSPIILFASLGDNITPPQQAFNWVADVYKSTDEIKARGQVIVGLMHKDIGHLGIFVSGRVAKKEHAQIVTVLKSIEALPPGLYGMKILDKKSENNKVEYEVQFTECQLEDVEQRLNRFKRADEKPFEVVAQMAELLQNGYELFGRPLVQSVTTEAAAKLSRFFNPIRVQHWAISDLNPWLMWLGPAAENVRAHRRPLGPEALPRQAEQLMSEGVSSSLDFGRAIRDTFTEVLFYQIYGNLLPIYYSQSIDQHIEERQKLAKAQQLPFIKEALASIAEGGYPEALARVFALLARPGVPLTLAQFELKKEMAEKYANFLPVMTPHEHRRIRGEQDIIVRYQPERAMETLPKLLAKEADRRKLRMLVDRLMSEEGFKNTKLTVEQSKTLDRILNILGPSPAKSPERKKTSKSKSRRGMQPA